jgi:hypothetical protein
MSRQFKGGAEFRKIRRTVKGITAATKISPRDTSGKANMIAKTKEIQNAVCGCTRAAAQGGRPTLC